MKTTLLTLILAAAAVGATAAGADEAHRRAGRLGDPRIEAGRGDRESWRGDREGWRGDREGWRGDREGWRGERDGWRGGGRRELRRVERWVSGPPVPVWVPGACWGEWGQTRCQPGSWQRRALAPHLEVHEEWVWVPGRW
jgi:hypothetical protein